MRLGPKNNWMIFLIGVVCLIHITAGFPLPVAKAAPGAAAVESIRVEVLTMHRLRLKQQVIERLIKQCADLVEGPVVTQVGIGRHNAKS